MASISEQITNWIIGIGSIFFSSISGTDATFTTPDIYLDHGQLIVTTSLSDWYTPELDQILASGQEITIHYHLVLRRMEPEDSLVTVSDFSHHLKYDLVDKLYIIVLSESEEQHRIENLNEARSMLGSVHDYPLIHTSAMEDGSSYQFFLEATMESIEFSGFSKTINLMNFWRGKKPRRSSLLFRKSQFIS